MSVVLQHDSRANVTYAYHNECLWDRETKKAGAKRTLIGKIDPETDEIIPTSGSRRKNPVDEAMVSAEIEEYNRRIREKRAKEGNYQNIDEKQLRQLKEQYDDLLTKYEDIRKVLRSFADSIDLVVERR